MFSSSPITDTLFKEFPCSTAPSLLFYMERGSSVVECRTRNLVSPGSNTLCYRFEDWAFSFSSLTPQLTQLYK